MAKFNPLILVFTNKYQQLSCPRGNGEMDKALACYAGGRGLIPAVGKNYSNGFLSLGHKEVGSYL